MSVHNNSNSSQPPSFLVLPDLNGFAPQTNTPPNAPSTPPRRLSLPLPSTPPRRSVNFGTMSDRSASSSSQTSANSQPSFQSTAVSTSNLVHSLLYANAASSQTSANTQAPPAQSLGNRVSQSTSNQNNSEDTLPTSPAKRQRTGDSAFHFRSPWADSLPFNSPGSSFQNASEAHSFGSPANSCSSIGSTPGFNSSSPYLGSSTANLLSLSLNSPSSSVKRSAGAAFSSPSSSLTQSTSATSQTPRRNGISLFGNRLPSLSLQNATGTATTPSYADAPFIKNADAKRQEISCAARNKTDVKINVQGVETWIDGSSLEKLGSGNFSIVYKCKTKEAPHKELVIRFFKTAADLLSPTSRDLEKVSPQVILKYLGNQLAHYLTIQTNAFLADHQVKFCTFEDLIERAKNDRNLRLELQALLVTDNNCVARRRNFVIKHLTDGYIVADYVGKTLDRSSLTEKTLVQLNRIKTLYENLEIPLDPGLGNWSQTLKMFDLYEESLDKGDHPCHVRMQFRSFLSEEQYDQYFGTAANLTKEDLELTYWGKLLRSDTATSSSAAAALPAE